MILNNTKQLKYGERGIVVLDYLSTKI